ncbi:uncharacterized protein PFL1_02738 [Pseudozyma flocculosa PF-1]|uniref:Related to CNS1 - cyclophilin seven suppressor n=2 Tax=Pseudozyma flocculosa TaxID=84751 RepID=A0A5C3F1W2_9BASI|nr:uncharacterized protein PFL1_02738 [Pseudozyma flocculosa PF-1]EPQ29519.1 hypothetical protein PFL1_02738 [Pseudozyma flocculosa PF-1]SPO38060.1 related to CNS1 - cyclophilin seven suppressor [Pseudozyma flocculosa]
MAIIEPVPDTPTPTPPQSSTGGPAAPAPSAGSGPSETMAGWANQTSPSPRNLEETLKSFDSIPFFMQDLDPSNVANDPAAQTKLEALQALAFDGTPDEVAANFKEQGNTNFVHKRFREAAGFYTQAIEAGPEDKALRETLHVNRAACNLELQNYGMCLRDTSATLAINPRNIKAYYRAARALLALDRSADCVKTCDLALTIDDANQAIAALRKKAQERDDLVKRQALEKAERERRKRETEAALTQAFLSRGLWLESSPRPPDNPTPAHFDPEELPPHSSPKLPLVAPPSSSSSSSTVRWQAPDPIRTPLVLPVFFIYPAHAQSDLIQCYAEDTPLHLHLESMFPSPPSLPWDTKGEYVADNLNVYATTHKQRLLKLGKKLTLRQIMDQAAKDSPDPKKPQDRDGMVMRDGMLSLVVVPKGDEEKAWVERFKKQRDEAKKQ